MKEPRKVGLALIFLGVVILLGNTTEALPPEAFFAGLFLYPIGGYLFFTGSRVAIREAEARAARIRAPRLKNETAEKFAGMQKKNIEANGSVDSQVRTAGSPAIPGTQPQAQAGNDDVTSEPNNDATHASASSNVASSPAIGPIDAESDNFKVTSDVSFPIEVQQHDSLADQLTKLHRLKEDGIISADEMAIAKAKLLT